MNNNSWFKKEMPLQTVIGFGGGATGFGAHSSAVSKTYVDEVFSTYVYEGTGEESGSTGQTITNGIDLAGEGGMTWIKGRTNTIRPAVVDTVRGAGKMLAPTETSVSTAADLTGLASFNSDGFTLGNESGGYQRCNMDGIYYASWSFRNAPGFFDVVTWTGTGSGRSISHNLGSVPGMIIVRKTNTTNNWIVYHRDTSSNVDNVLFLNLTDSVNTDSPSYWNNGGAQPTSTTFNVGWGDATNASGGEYVAYVFAGGESTAATARSVEFDASGDYLSLASSSDLAMGTGDFTVEGWFKVNGGSNYAFWMNGANGLGSDIGVCVWYYSGSSYGLTFNNGSDQTTNVHPPAGQWFHLAYVRSSGTTSLYYNGKLLKSASNTINYTNQTFVIGGYTSTSYLMNGSVSNFRVVKGTAVYTSSFRPPTEPLTNITNTKLLCCNDSSITGSTVSPGTITSHGDPTASTDSPFDDPEGFKFGENEDQNIIKTGSYIGNGSATGPEINLGWEPSFIIMKNAEKYENWLMWDSMRGIVTDGNDARLFPNLTTAESSPGDFIDLTSTGFKINDNGGDLNEPNDKIVYMAIRRPDGYVGKPASAGTDAFTMAGGNSTGTTWISGFPVGFALYKRYAYVDDWIASARQIQGKYLAPSNATAENSHTSFNFDKNNGWGDLSLNSTWLSYMWKRNAGFDVVAYEGNGVGGGRQIPHSLNKAPEMIWVKNRDSTTDWNVYHKGLDGGTNPEQKYLVLNTDAAEADNVNRWNDTAPTSTIFTIGDSGRVNTNAHSYIAMLFASANDADDNPISKVGSYSGANSNQTITLGFQPRFIIIKSTSSSRNWVVLDTVRGWSSGSNDSELNLNKSDAAGSSYDFGGPTATGFTINYIGNDDTNASGHTYIYYAHA